MAVTFLNSKISHSNSHPCSTRRGIQQAVSSHCPTISTSAESWPEANRQMRRYFSSNATGLNYYAKRDCKISITPLKIDIEYCLPSSPNNSTTQDLSAYTLWADAPSAELTLFVQFSVFSPWSQQCASCLNSQMDSPTWWLEIPSSSGEAICKVSP